MSDSITIKVTDNPTVDKRVHFEWPKQDTRIPESQRQPVQISGYVDCGFAYFPQDELEAQDDRVADGELTAEERFKLLVPSIKGLPTADGQSPYDWLKSHRYGAVIRNAIMADYFENMGEARRGNSGKRRSR